VTDLSTYWKNLPDTSTPLEASVLNTWGGEVEAVRDAAIAARDEAQAAAESASAPADDQIATLVQDPGSATRGQMDAAFGPLQGSKDAAFIGNWGILSTAPGDAAANSSLIATALAQSKILRLPAGTFPIGSTIALTGGMKLMGAGRGATVLTSADSTLTAVTMVGESVAVSGLTITKSVTPTTTACYGIDAGQTTDGAMIQDVRVERHGVGIRLGGAGLSRMQDVLVQWNLSHGVFFTNAVSTINSLQWYCTNVLSQGNSGDGYRVQSTAGKGNCSFGKLVSCYTFANSGRGCIVSAPALADRINSFRMSDCFFGEDGNDELYLDTFGGSHQITNSFLELAGSRATGPGIFTGSGSATSAAQSNVGTGATLTANNEGVVVSACQFVQNSRTGLYSSAIDLVAQTNILYANGRALTAASRYGIHIPAGSAVITGNRAKNINGVTYQEYGAAFGVTDVTFALNDIRGNASAGTSGVVPVVNVNNRT
jgi:hypothetical protein